MAYSILTPDDGVVEHHDRYGDATREARKRSDDPQAGCIVYQVRNDNTEEIVNGFQFGWPICDLHGHARMQMRGATTTEALHKIVENYAADLGRPELAEMSYDEAALEIASRDDPRRVFVLATDRWDELVCAPSS